MISLSVRRTHRPQQKICLYICLNFCLFGLGGQTRRMIVRTPAYRFCPQTVRSVARRGACNGRARQQGVSASRLRMSQSVLITTRFRPNRFASYRASSAWCTNISGVIPSANRATPALKVIFLPPLFWRTVSFSLVRIRSRL
jgi:hypothetical protein